MTFLPFLQKKIKKKRQIVLLCAVITRFVLTSERIISVYLSVTEAGDLRKVEERTDFQNINISTMHHFSIRFIKSIRLRLNLALFDCES